MTSADLPDCARAESRRRFEIMCALARVPASLPKEHRFEIAATQWNAEHPEDAITPRALRDWERRIRGLPREEWPSALAPAWRAGGRVAAISPEVEAYIRSEWATQSQPALRPIYRRLKRIAQKMGWALPSYRTLARRVAAMPVKERVLRREGPDAFSKLYSPIQVDRTALDLHRRWCSDGRRADVFCRWPDGEVTRPMVMFWMEERSRKYLGLAADKRGESMALVLKSFHRSAEECRALPSEVHIDNGRAYAGKAITGGQKTRNRFKVRNEELRGIFTDLGIEAIWATPYRGQVKLIESAHNTIAEMEKGSAFVGAYCGNRPDMKPEECDREKAVPIEDYLARAEEAMALKNAEPHTGLGMDGRSPNEIYDELIASTPARTPTTEQLRDLRLMRREVRLDRHHSIWIGSHRYWCEQLLELPERAGPLMAKHDPDDPLAPLRLYDGHRFICEVPHRGAIPATDRERVSQTIRDRRRFEREAKAQDRARRAADAELLKALPTPESRPLPLKLARDETPRPKVLKLVPPPRKEPAPPPQLPGILSPFELSVREERRRRAAQGD